MIPLSDQYPAPVQEFEFINPAIKVGTYVAANPLRPMTECIFNDPGNSPFQQDEED